QQFLLTGSDGTNVWQGNLELSLMVFDDSDRNLKVIGGVRTSRDGMSAYPFPERNSLPYGVGVAGKAYKTNTLGLWARTPAEERTAPDRYVPLDGNYLHQALLSIPLQNPADPRYVFAIANVGSDDPQCPLIGLQDRANAPALLGQLQKTLSEKAFDRLK